MSYASPYQFATFRALLGLFMTLFFLLLVADAPHIFLEPAGMGSNRFPVFQFLGWFQSATALRGLIVFLAILSLVFALGHVRRWIGFVLWFAWIGLFLTQDRIEGMEIFAVEWMLFVSVMAPSGEPGLFRRATPTPHWRLPALLYWGSWTILGLSYALKAYMLFSNPNWMSGQMLTSILNSYYARDHALNGALGHLSLSFFSVTATIIAWSYLLFPAALLLKSLRLAAWVWLGSFHLITLLLLKSVALPVSFLLLHLLVFDRRWFYNPRKPATRQIVFFDGDCGLCQASIRFLMTEDPEGKFHFAPLQGSTAQRRLGEQPETPEALVLWQKGRTRTGADAALHIAQELGGLFAAARILRLLPSPFLEACYRLVARYRFKLWSKDTSCPLPTSAQQARMLP